MTLTRAQLLDKGKPRCEEVEIEGLGSVWIRSIDGLKKSRRLTQAGNTDEKIRQFLTRRSIYAVIDQICSAPDQPMFTEDDFDQVAALDSVVLSKLYGAIAEFNGEGKKKDPESADFETNSETITDLDL